MQPNIEVPKIEGQRVVALLEHGDHGQVTLLRRSTDPEVCAAVEELLEELEHGDPEVGGAS